MMSTNVGEFKSHTRSLLTHTVLIDCGARAVCSRVVCSPLPSITMSVVLGVWCCWLGWVHTHMIHDIVIYRTWYYPVVHKSRYYYLYYTHNSPPPFSLALCIHVCII